MGSLTYAQYTLMSIWVDSKKMFCCSLLDTTKKKQFALSGSNLCYFTSYKLTVYTKGTQLALAFIRESKALLNSEESSLIRESKAFLNSEWELTYPREQSSSEFWRELTYPREQSSSDSEDLSVFRIVTRFLCYFLLNNLKDLCIFKSLCISIDLFSLPKF